MGLLMAMGDGLAAGMEQGVKDLEQESQFKRAMAMMKEKLSMESAQRRDDKQWEMDKAEELRKKHIGEVDAKANAIASGEQASNLNNAQAIYEQYAKENPEGAQLGLEEVSKARGLLATPTLRQRAEAAALVTGKGYEDILRLDASQADRDASREERRADREIRDQQHKDSLAESRRYHDIIAGDKAARRDATSALDKLPEATKLQVSSNLRTIEKLEARYYSLKPNDFNSPEEYKAERDSLRAQIGDINTRTDALISGKKPESKTDLFPPKDAPKKDQAADKSAQPTPSASKSVSAGYEASNPIQYRHVVDNISLPSMQQQALEWIEGNNLTAQQKQEVLRKLSAIKK